LVPPPATWGEGQFSPPRGPSHPSSTASFIKLALLIVAIATGFYYFAAGEDPKTVVNRCLDGIQELNADKVLSCVRPADRAHFAPLGTLFMTYKSQGYSIRLTDRKVDIVDKKSDTCMAQISYVAVVTARGQTQQAQPVNGQPMPLLKENGHWYVADISPLMR